MGFGSGITFEVSVAWTLRIGTAENCLAPDSLVKWLEYGLIMDSVNGEWLILVNGCY